MLGLDAVELFGTRDSVRFPDAVEVARRRQVSREGWEGKFLFADSGLLMLEEFAFPEISRSGTGRDLSKGVA